MNADGVRDAVFREVLWRTEYHCSHTGPWDGVLDACPRCHAVASEVVDGLAGEGFLPVAQEGRYIGRGLLRRTRFVGAWQEPAE